MVPNYISNPRTLLSIREVYPSPNRRKTQIRGSWAQRSVTANPNSDPDSPCARAGEKRPCLVCCLAPLTTHHAYLEPTAFLFVPSPGLMPACPTWQCGGARRDRDQ